MKKKLAGILATLACLACFSSCAQLDGVLDTVKGTVGNVKDKITSLLPGGDEKKEASANLPAAKSYLDSIYKAGNGSATVANYTLMGNVPVKNGDVSENFSVSWTVDKTDYVEVVKNENGSYTVNIKNSEPKEDIVYTLKATITDANGFTLESTFTRKIPLVKYTQAEIVDMAYALEKGASIEETLTLTGVISMVESPYDEGYKNITVIIRVAGREDKPIECYRLKGEGADKIDVGDTIKVSGTLTNYNGTIEFTSGCELVSAEQTGPEKPNFANDEEIVNAVYALEDGYSLVGGKYELTGKITEVKNAYDAGYGNATFTIVVGNLTDKPIVCYRAKGLDIAQVGTGITVGTTVKVSGVLINYGGTYEFTAGCLIVEHDAKLDAPVVPEITNPELGEDAYTFSFAQTKPEEKTLYLDGGVSGRYLTTTEDETAAVSVYAEKVEKSYKFYILVDEVKQYINIYKNDEGKVSVNYAAETTCVYNYNDTTKVWYTNFDGTDYYLGSYYSADKNQTFNTVSASKTSYITAENTGVTQYPITLNEAAKTYTLVITDGYAWAGGLYEEKQVAPGTALELPTREAEGKIFKGWYSFTYDEDGNETVAAAPATMPEETLVLRAVWEVIPYNVTIKYNDGTVYKTFKIGADDVYAENEADVIIAASGMAWVLSMEEFPEGYVLKEEIPQTFELKEYTFTLLKKVNMTVINGNPRLDPNAVTTSEVLEGSAIELTAPTAEGKEFLGWIDVEGNAAPTVVPNEDFAVYANWKVTPYTLTIKQDGAEDKVFTFGVEYTMDINIAVTDLAYVLEDNLPEDTDTMDYEWSTTLPETFALQNYEFTIVANAIYYNLTLINGNPRLPGAVTESQAVAGATLNLPALTAEGKNFLGWFSFTYDEEDNLTQTAAPATMPEADLTLTAVWEVIPYTLTIKQTGAEDKVFTFGVEYTMDINIAVTDLASVLTSNIPEGYVVKEEVPETFGLENYTFTLLKKVTMTVINGNQRLDPNAVTTSEVVEGDAIELPTLTAEGKEFLGWIDVEGNAAPTVVPAEDFAVYANWKVTPYTLTIKQEGAEDKVFTFGVEYTMDINIAVTDLAYVLADNLPANTATVEYAWEEAIPETFELTDYTFTVIATEVLSIPAANEKGAEFASGKYSEEKYYVYGTIVNVVISGSYGNVTIADAEGNTFYIYGVYVDGAKYGDVAEDARPVFGDEVKLFGVVGSFSNVPQMKNADLISYSTPETVADVYKVVAETFNIETPSSIIEASDVTVITAGKTYTDVVISWASDNACAVVNGGTISFSIPAADVEVTLTATLTLGDVTKTVEYKVEVKANMYIPTVDQACYLSSTVDGTTYYFNGTISGGRVKTTTNVAEAVTVTLKASSVEGKYYMVYSNNGTETYIGYASSTKFAVSTEVPTDNDKYLWDISSSYIANVNSGRIFMYYADGTDFRAYAASNLGTYPLVWFAAV